MRNRSPLALVELLVMVMVFALAAALCLRAFVWADGRSREQEAHDRALLCAQNAAQTLKSCRGDLDEAAQRHGGVVREDTWSIDYDEYRMEACRMPQERETLGGALVRVWVQEALLACLEVKWQEVGGHE